MRFLGGRRRLGAAAAALVAALVGAGAAEASTYMRIYLNESKIIRVDGLKRVSVTNPGVATPVIISPNEIMLNGGAVGRTSLYIWDAAGRTEIQVVVRPFTEEIEKAIADEIDNPNVKVQLINEGNGERLFMRGTLENAAQHDEILEIARAYLSPAAQIVDLIEVQGVSETPLSALQRLIRNPEVNIEVITAPGNPNQVSNIILEGYVDDQQDLQRIEAIANSFVQTSGGAVTNLLEVVNPLQVMIEGHLVELTRNRNQTTGVTWGTVDSPAPGGAVALANFQENTLSFVENFLHSVSRGPLGNSVGPRASSISDIKRTNPLAANLNFIRNNGQGRIIENPKVVTRSGEQASISVGGEVGSIVSAGFGAQSAEFRSFGLDMQVTPTVDHRGNIQTDVNLSLSTPDLSLGATLAGSTVPGFRRRATQNSVTVRDGEHIVISGLIDRQEQTAMSRVPFLSKIPVLGKLFQSKTFQRAETELVVIVTPHLLASKRLRERFYPESLSEDQRAALEARVQEEAAGAKAAATETAAVPNEDMVKRMFAGLNSPLEGSGGTVDRHLARGTPTASVRPGLGRAIAKVATVEDPMSGAPMGNQILQPTAQRNVDPSARIRNILEQRRSNQRGVRTRRELAMRTEGVMTTPRAPAALPPSRPAPAAPALPVQAVAPAPSLGADLAPPAVDGLVPARGSISSRIHSIFEDLGDGSAAASPAPVAASGGGGIDARVDELFDEIRNRLEGGE